MSRTSVVNPQVAQTVENAVPIREPSVALLTVDTFDRLRFSSDGFAVVPTPSINNLLINKQTNLLQGYFTRISLTELNIPWNIPNVNETNNTLTLFLAATGENESVTVTVPEGFYNGTRLATTLTTLFASAIATLPPIFQVEFTIVVSYDTTTARFTITNTKPAPTNLFFIQPKNLNQDDDLTNMMGYGAIPNDSDVLLSQNIWRGGYASMQYTPYVDIISQQLTKKQRVNDGSTNALTGRQLLHRLYLTPVGYTVVPTVFQNAGGVRSAEMPGTQPFIIHEQFSVPKQIAWDAREFINVLDISLRDYKGNILYEVPNTQGDQVYQLGTGNTNFQLTLSVTEE